MVRGQNAALAGNEMARYSLGCIEFNSGTSCEALEDCCISWKFSCHGCHANCLCVGRVSRESINSTLAAYNTSCAEMRSEARDAYMHADIGSSINEKV